MEQLKVILESEILNDESKKQIQEAFEAMKESAIEEASKELEVKYAMKFEERSEAVTAELVSAVAAMVEDEIKELKEDVEKYRHLEVEYATKLQDFKDEYQVKLAESVNNTVTSIVSEELTELREDLEESRKHHMGQRIFEAFKKEYEQFGVEEETKEVIAGLEAKLQESATKLEESNAQIETLKRDSIMEGLLSNLTGSKRAVMATVLEGVETAKLEDRYNEAIKQVLSESEAPKEEEDKPGIVVESKDDDNAEDRFARLRELMG